MGGRMCTRKDVAEHASVSVTTVSNVLNHSKEARPEIVERVKKAAKELNYHPNLIAKGLKMNNSMQVGVIISEINNPYFIDVLQGIEEEAAVHGYNVSIFFIKGDIWHKYKDLMGRRFAGVINLSNIPYTQELQTALMKQGAHLVCFDPLVSSQVNFDARPALKELMLKAKEYGHRKLSYAVGFPEEVARQDERVNTYMCAYEELGFEKHPYQLIYGDFPKTSSEQNGVNTARFALAHHCEASAYFAINDMCALGMMSEFSRAGLHVPDDISVIGCDGIAISELVYPQIATIDVPRNEIGRRMMLEIRNAVAGGESTSVTMSCRALFRESLGKAKS